MKHVAVCVAGAVLALGTVGFGWGFAYDYSDPGLSFVQTDSVIAWQMGWADWRPAEYQGLFDAIDALSARLQEGRSRSAHSR